MIEDAPAPCADTLAIIKEAGAAPRPVPPTIPPGTVRASLVAHALENAGAIPLDDLPGISRKCLLVAFAIALPLDLVLIYGAWIAYKYFHG